MVLGVADVLYNGDRMLSGNIISKISYVFSETI